MHHSMISSVLFVHCSFLPVSFSRMGIALCGWAYIKPSARDCLPEDRNSPSNGRSGTALLLPHIQSRTCEPTNGSSATFLRQPEIRGSRSLRARSFARAIQTPCLCSSWDVREVDRSATLEQHSTEDLSFEKGCHASGVGAILPCASSHLSGLNSLTSSPQVAKRTSACLQFGNGRGSRTFRTMQAVVVDPQHTSCYGILLTIMLDHVQIAVSFPYRCCRRI